MSAGDRLRGLMESGIVALPGVFNALTARMAEGIGFRAAYMSGGALSAGWAGVPDVGLLSLTEFTEQAAVLVRATSLPILSDADTGFGEAMNVERAVRLFEGAGVAGIHLEDQELPKRCGHLTGKSLVSVEEMVSKIRAAVAARRDPGFVIVARSDARSVEGYEAMVDRARRYVEAGADLVFPEALESEAEFRQAAREIPAGLVANMTEFGRGPLLSVDELGAMGYRGVLFPLTAFRAAMKELHQAGTQRGMIDSLQTRAELYEWLDYRGFEARDRSFFGGGGRAGD
jgi:methylisocitrate lyase